MIYLMDEIITLDYGSGGKKTSRLIEESILKAFEDPELSRLGDGAILPGGEQLVFSTDSFVVSPLFFPGGDIGKLSVCGTVNDIAMCGGEPKYLSCSFILEEGLPRAELRSDCAALNGLAAALLEAVPETRCLRDPTRGGVATTLNEFVEGRSLGIELEESLVPVRPAVRAACELLGLEPLYCANEGKLLAVVPPEKAEAALKALRSLPEGENAALIGSVTAAYPGKLTVRTALGGRRVLQKLAGAQLPRIC